MKSDDPYLNALASFTMIFIILIVLSLLEPVAKLYVAISQAIFNDLSGPIINLFDALLK